MLAKSFGTSVSVQAFDLNASQEDADDVVERVEYTEKDLFSLEEDE
jgi:hypothetical protein